MRPAHRSWPLPRLSLRSFVLAVLAVLSLCAGLGMRDPSPPDEPRFALAARDMVESGQWMFPHRGIELYAEKPPVFMWLQAASYRLVGDWEVAFLLPSLLAALLTLALTWDLARRLWNPRVGRHAAAALFVCLQFGLQAKRGQIDMVLVAMTTLSLWALLRHLLQGPDWRMLWLGMFAAGLGTVTKGVGFLPVLVLLPWLALRWSPRPSTPALSRPGLQRGDARRWAIAMLAFVAGTAVWVAPMLATVWQSQDPVLHQYARELLFKQTGTRYADAWHHVQPAWYYLQVIATLWLPGALLLPWLLPAWWRRLRRGDPRLWLLLGWSALVLLFFSLSPGKREVYIFPMLPALCVAAGPLLPGLLRRAGVRRVLCGYLLVFGLAACLLSLAALAGWSPWAHRLAGQRDIDQATLQVFLLWVLGLGLVILATLLWAQLRRTGSAVVLATVAIWVAYGAGLAPTLDADSSSRELMQRVAQRIGPDAELGMVAWREQNMLQSVRPVVDFGFKRSWHEQWNSAAPWLLAQPQQRWLFVLDDALSPCVERSRSVAIGQSNRKSWLLVPASALDPGCITPAWEPSAFPD
jgi:4-amino-4-deoxy-L-arabinose transferase-like glycosyltransferase